MQIVFYLFEIIAIPSANSKMGHFRKMKPTSHTGLEDLS